MLEIKNISICYGSDKMNYNLTVENGDCIALIGPSGGGKTTLLNLIAGFLKPNSGKIYFNDDDLTKLSPDKRPLTMLFQEHNLFPNLNLFENIAIGVNPSLKITAEQRQNIKKAINDAGLNGKELSLPKELSGGQRQRVALARSLVRERPLLLLDEPFSALDPGLRLQMLELVAEIQKNNGLTILMVSHNPEDAKLIAKKIAYIDDGEVKSYGNPETVLNDPLLNHYLGQL